MLISVSHVTRYIYDEPVNYTVQSLRLTPAQFKGQRIATSIKHSNESRGFRADAGENKRVGPASECHRTHD